MVYNFEWFKLCQLVTSTVSGCLPASSLASPTVAEAAFFISTDSPSPQLFYAAVRSQFQPATVSPVPDGPCSDPPVFADSYSTAAVCASPAPFLSSCFDQSRCLAGRSAPLFRARRCWSAGWVSTPVPAAVSSRRSTFWWSAGTKRFAGRWFFAAPQSGLQTFCRNWIFLEFGACLTGSTVPLAKFVLKTLLSGGSFLRLFCGFPLPLPSGWFQVVWLASCWSPFHGFLFRPVCSAFKEPI